MAKGLDLLKKGKTYNVVIWNSFYEKLVTWENVKFLSIYEDIAYFDTKYKTSGGYLVLHVDISDKRTEVNIPY
jgi:hypothetical protein